MVSSNNTTAPAMATRVGVISFLRFESSLAASCAASQASISSPSGATSQAQIFLARYRHDASPEQHRQPTGNGGTDGFNHHDVPCFNKLTGQGTHEREVGNNPVDADR